jgi:aspartyl-tRNA(Asn)/glutamyl-tRNA(Gln) amidotransferase subunit B
MIKEYGLSAEQAELICDEKTGADYFEAAAAEIKKQMEAKGEISGQAVRIANWFLSDIKHILNQKGMALKDIGSFALNPRRLAALAVMLGAGRITGKLAKQCMEIIAAEDRDPEEIVRANNWEQLADPAKIAEVVRTVFAAEKKTAAELRAIIAAASGVPGSEKRKKTLTAYLVGKVLAATGGRADPKIAGIQVEEML